METIPFGSIEKALSENGEIATCTAGISMYPMLRNRRDVSVIRVPDRPFRVNDVPVYRLRGGKLVMHRIIDIKDGKYIIRGDNLLVKEKNVTDDMIIGRLVGFYRNNKYYDCETSKKYKAYVFITTHTFFLRYIWKKLIRPTLSKIKHLIIKQK